MMTKSFDAVRERLEDLDSDSLAAIHDVLGIVAAGARTWTRRCDDAKRISDLIHDFRELVLTIVPIEDRNV